MEFKQRTAVVTADNQEAGHIERVVIDPRTDEVTHLVIRIGLLPPKHKVVPIDSILTSNEQRIAVGLNADALDELPDFEETEYILLDEEKLDHSPKDLEAARLAPLFMWYPPYPRSPLLPVTEAPYEIKTRLNIPDGTIAVKEGAKVITRDGKRTGHVDEVLTSADEETRVTHLLIATGLLQKEKKLIPITWIESLKEDEVCLAIESDVFEKLPDFEHT